MWVDVAPLFEVDDGSLLDAYVFDVGPTDWQLVVDTVRGQSWSLDYTVDGFPSRLPQDVRAIFAAQPRQSTTLHIRPVADVLVNTHFFSDDEIEFDFSPHELQGQERLDVLCSFLRTIGRALAKPIVVTPENTPGCHLLTYTPADDRTTVTA